jgi:pyridoxine kinase
MGPRIVLVTSLATPDTPSQCIDILAGAGGEFWRLRTDRLDLHPNGAGDLLSGLFLFHLANGASVQAALELAGSALHGTLRRTLTDGARELRIIAAQAEFLSPSQRYFAEFC